MASPAADSKKRRGRPALRCPLEMSDSLMQSWQAAPLTCPLFYGAETATQIKEMKELLKLLQKKINLAKSVAESNLFQPKTKSVSCCIGQP